MGNLPDSFWRLASAHEALHKANCAAMQTGEFGRKKTIINVDVDEAVVIYWALQDYIEKHEKEHEK